MCNVSSTYVAMIYLRRHHRSAEHTQRAGGNVRRWPCRSSLSRREKGLGRLPPLRRSHL